MSSALLIVLSMRLKSEIWVKAYLRRCQGEGAAAVVVRHGDDDAGVILIKVARLDGTADLYGPAPAGYVSDDMSDGDRRWTCLATASPDLEIEARLTREVKLDHDAWIIELEDRNGRSFLEGWVVAQ